MKDWINKLRIWLIHKLGGYTRAECVVGPDKLTHLTLTQRYPLEDAGLRVAYGLGIGEASAVSRFMQDLRQYVIVDKRIDEETMQIVVRTSIRIIDDRR